MTTKLARVENVTGGWILEVLVSEDGHLEIKGSDRTNTATNVLYRLLNINPGEIASLGQQLIKNADKHWEK